MTSSESTCLRRVLLLGATGLVGRELLVGLEAEAGIGEIVAAVRTPLAAPGPKTRVERVDFARLDDVPEIFAVDQVFCALGTTLRKAGSRPAFRSIDLDLPLELARRARAADARGFFLVSSLGAKPDSRAFYTRVKGELEAGLRAQGWPQLVFARPSLLLGERSEFRPGEEVAKRLAWLVPRAWKPVQAWQVAAGLLEAAREDAAGCQILKNRDLHEHRQPRLSRTGQASQE